MPGSGKTTVAEALRARLEAAGIECVSRNELAADGCGFMWRHVRRVGLIVRQAPGCARHYAWLARFVSRSRQSSRADALKVFWNLCTVAALVNQHRGKGHGVMILDQGLAQAVWSVGIGASDETARLEEWHEILVRIGSGDVSIVLLHVSAAVARQRIASRKAPASRMEREDWFAEAARWERAERLCGHLALGIAQLAAAGLAGAPPALLELDAAAGEPGALAAEIQARLFRPVPLPESTGPCQASAA